MSGSKAQNHDHNRRYYSTYEGSIPATAIRQAKLRYDQCERRPGYWAAKQYDGDQTCQCHSVCHVRPPTAYANCGGAQ
jgi:hypothetical protein